MATLAAIELIPVNSSRLAAIGHDPETFTLAVMFPPTKKAPTGKIYHYSSVSEELYDDLKNAESIGVFFGMRILNDPDKYPFVCVDEGLGEASRMEVEAELAVEAVPTVAEILPPAIPDDEEGLKTLAMTTRAEVTSLTISTAEECEIASHEVLRIRAERKLAIEKVNKIKIPATAAWKAACELFNEIDGRYAEAEKYLDGGILSFRVKEKARAAAEAAALQRKQDADRAEAIRVQQEEFKRLQAEAAEEARVKAAELAESDAKIAEAQGASAETVEQIRENPLPVVARHVEQPPIAYMSSAPAVIKQELPKVQGLGFTTAWLYEVTNEAAIPLSHDYYTLDLKKVNAKVQALKQHANIPGVRVWDEERSIKKPGSK
jgi:hypothetical protein